MATITIQTTPGNYFFSGGAVLASSGSMSLNLVSLDETQLLDIIQNYETGVLVHSPSNLLAVKQELAKRKPSGNGGSGGEVDLSDIRQALSGLEVEIPDYVKVLRDSYTSFRPY